MLLISYLINCIHETEEKLYKQLSLINIIYKINIYEVKSHHVFQHWSYSTRSRLRGKPVDGPCKALNIYCW